MIAMREQKEQEEVKYNEKGVKAKESASGGGMLVEIVVLEEGMNLE
jgi:hypothetical protein